MSTPEMVERARAQIQRLFDDCYDTTVPGQTFDGELRGALREFAQAAVREAVSECIKIAEDDGRFAGLEIASAIRQKYGVEE